MTNEKVEQILTEAIRKANGLGWIQKGGTGELPPERYYIYLVDVEKIILGIFEREDIKNCMMLGELEDEK